MNDSKELTLFLNTANGLKLVLLNNQFIPIDQIEVDTLRAGNILHERIDFLLQKNNFKISNLLNLVTIAGPGSYTGLRFSEGLGQIFDWNEINHYSCLSYEIPSFVDKDKNYSFFMPAFKGEMLLVKYDGIDFESSRCKNSVFEHELKELELESAFGEGCLDIDLFFEQNISTIIKKIVHEKIKRPIYYFREIHEEFNKSN